MCPVSVNDVNRSSVLLMVIYSNLACLYISACVFRHCLRVSFILSNLSIFSINVAEYITPEKFEHWESVGNELRVQRADHLYDPLTKQVSKKN